ncbi:MAG TPA: MazG family protein, partial [Chloroflexota bacterium]|nr:MazG family protein [Chloroflexota bacterium]
MGSITVAGLGPGARGQVTTEVADALQHAANEGRLLLRTRIHPTVSGWPALETAPSLDHHYEGSDDFGQAYERIAADVLARAADLPRDADLVYAVPGHPLIAEATVQRVCQLARESDVAVRILPGLSFVDAVVLAAELEAADGLRVADALALGRIDPTAPLLICQVYSRHIAGQVKLALGRHYPDEHEVLLVHAAGVPGQERVERLQLLEVDRRDGVAHLTSLWVPPLAPLQALREPQTLQEVMASLRAPAPEGCPWDREQTHETLRRYLLEETYEALDAIDSGDVRSLEEELGDLLLQIVFHAQIADEAGLFDFGDVCAGISAKLIRRHPHVFGDLKEQDAAAVLRNWEQLKREERAKKDQAGRSMLDGVPASMPALSYTQSVQDLAARV